jgi:hypothetical protein
MIHPFLPDLSSMSLEELQEKSSTLTQNLTFAYRMGNTALIQQVTMILEGYRTEISKRLDDLYKKQNLGNQVNIKKDSQ